MESTQPDIIKNTFLSHTFCFISSKSCFRNLSIDHCFSIQVIAIKFSNIIFHIWVCFTSGWNWRVNIFFCPFSKTTLLSQALSPVMAIFWNQSGTDTTSSQWLIHTIESWLTHLNILDSLTIESLAFPYSLFSQSLTFHHKLWTTSWWP